VVLRGFGPAATLVNEELDLTAEQCPWLSLEALSTEPTVLTVMWRNEEETYSKERARVRLVPATETEVSTVLTVSGWRQQQEKEGYQGLYPDSWSMLTGDIFWGLMLGPLRLVRNQLALDGCYPEGDTRLFRRGDALVALLGPGRFEEVSAGVPGDGSRITDLPNGRFDLEFRHRFRNHSNCYVALVGATDPGEVKIDGVLAERVTDLDTVEQGWMWSPSMPGVVMRLHSSAKAPVSVQVSGLNTHPAVHQTRWMFDADPEGWTVENDLAAFEIRNGALVCVPTGGDPFLTVRLAGLDAKKFARVRIRYRTRQNGSMQLFWSPPTGYSAERSV